ncbi:hypothetical protein CF327_g5065 [Tilletia walkeri]|nr:hypothetical protein CF327_g5065 [Tilletia walkeri]
MPPTTRRMLRTPRSSVGDAASSSPSASASALDGGDGNGEGGSSSNNTNSADAPPLTLPTDSSGSTSRTATRTADSASASASRSDMPPSPLSRNAHLFDVRMPVRSGTDLPRESSSSSAVSTSRRRNPPGESARPAAIPRGMFWSFDGPPGPPGPPDSIPSIPDSTRSRTAASTMEGSSSRTTSGPSSGPGASRTRRQVRFTPTLPSSLTVAEYQTGDEARASGSAATGSSGPGASSSSSASRRRALSALSRLREGGEAPNEAIVLDDLFRSSDEDEDDDFTVVSSRTGTSAADRQRNMDWARQHLGNAAFEIAVRAGQNSAADRAGPFNFDGMPRIEPPLRSTRTHQIIDGIPAGPHRYRHRDRAVPAAQDPAATIAMTQNAIWAARLALDPNAPPPPVGGQHFQPDLSPAGQERVYRRFGMYPSMRYGTVEHRKIPDSFDVRWTHPHPEQEGFSNSIVEPPIEVDMEPGPLPDTTPICARCRYALQTGGTGDKKIWVLPCGHVIDGKCVRELSEPAWKGAEPPVSKALQNGEAKANGKARAVSIEPSEDAPQKRTASMRDAEEQAENEVGDKADNNGSAANSGTMTPPLKKRHLDSSNLTESESTPDGTLRGSVSNPIDADMSSQSFEIVYTHKAPTTSASASRRDKGKGSSLSVETTEDDEEPVIVSGVKLQPSPFTCPVVDCGQLCFPKGDHDLSIIEMFI